MSERGVFAVDRGVWIHPLFAPEPFTEREAWLWMISTAVWKPTKVRAGRKLIALARGQLVFSERFLAEKWKWAKTTVRRFINRLKSEAMVSTLADRDATLITICNYEKYAFDGTTRGPRTGPQSGPLADHSRTKEEELKKDKKEELSKKETRASALSSDPTLTWFETFWFMWPNKVGKPAALKAFRSAMGRAPSPEEILAGVERYIRDKPPDRQWLNPATFLNQNRWEDQPASVSVTNGKPKSAIIQAADDLCERLASFEGPPRSAGPGNELRRGEGQTVVRLLPHGRGE